MKNTKTCVQKTKTLKACPKACPKTLTKCTLSSLPCSNYHDSLLCNDLEFIEKLNNEEIVEIYVLNFLLIMMQSYVEALEVKHN